MLQKQLFQSEPEPEPKPEPKPEPEPEEDNSTEEELDEIVNLSSEQDDDASKILAFGEEFESAEITDL